MRFSRGDWKHENCIDVFIEVIKVQYVDSKRAKLRVIWWNLGYTGNPWTLTQAESLEIQAKDFPKWQRLQSRIRTMTDVA